MTATYFIFTCQVLEGNETFQVIISTNGQMSFATFIYDSPTSVTSKINVPNSPLSVGFDSGDNANATSYDASCAILEVVNVFQIDGMINSLILLFTACIVSQAPRLRRSAKWELLLVSVVEPRVSV